MEATPNYYLSHTIVEIFKLFIVKLKGYVRKVQTGTYD